MQYINLVAIVVGAIVGLGGLGATVWAIGKVKGVEATLDLLNLANAGLRDANNDLRTQLGDNERNNLGRISRLEGQLQALADGLGDKVATAIAAAIAARLEHSFAEALERALGRPHLSETADVAQRPRRSRQGPRPAAASATD